MLLFVASLRYHRVRKEGKKVFRFIERLLGNPQPRPGIEAWRQYLLY